MWEQILQQLSRLRFVVRPHSFVSKQSLLLSESQVFFTTLRVMRTKIVFTFSLFRPSKWVELSMNLILFISHSRRPLSWSRKLVDRSVSRFSLFMYTFPIYLQLSLVPFTYCFCLLLPGCHGQMYYGISFPYCHWCYSNHHRQGTSQLLYYYCHWYLMYLLRYFFHGLPWFYQVEVLTCPDFMLFEEPMKIRTIFL